MTLEDFDYADWEIPHVSKTGGLIVDVSRALIETIGVEMVMEELKSRMRHEGYRFIRGWRMALSSEWTRGLVPALCRELEIRAMNNQVNDPIPFLIYGEEER